MASFTLKCLQSHAEVCYPSIYLTVKHCKLIFLANISQSFNPILQELALKVDCGHGLLQINDNDHEILTQARKKLVAILSVKKLYLASKKVAIDNGTAQCTCKLQSLSVQCKFKDATSLET